MREERLTTYDGIPARVAAGLAAAVLLTGLTRLPLPRNGVDETVAVPATAPTLRIVTPEVPGPDLATSEADEPDEPVALPDPARVRRARPAPPPAVATLEPNRTFVPPPRKVRRVDPVRLDPPPQMSVARLDPPVIPSDPLNLQPPRRSPLRRFVSVLAVPFRHI